MWVFDLLEDLNVVKLDVQELVDGFERAFDRYVVLQFDGDFVVDKGFEEARSDKYGVCCGLYSHLMGTYLKNSIAGYA